jgi:tryptophan synthase alpha chain
MDLEDKFRDLKARREGAHMPHVYYGDPSEAFSIQLIHTLVDAGADMIEFGIPFSDPTADGATFQAACDRALKNGMTPTKCIEGIKKLRTSGLELPIIVTTYYNIPYVTGLETFTKKIKAAGAQAIIVPNLPIEEASDLLNEANKQDIRVILQVTPTTTDDRLQRIADAASGFLYVINVEGVTGVRERLTDSTLTLIQRVKPHTNVPVLAGFGISTRKQAATAVSVGADGVIVGSAYAKIYEKNLRNPEETLPDITRLAQQIKRGCIDGYTQRR